MGRILIQLHPRIQGVHVLHVDGSCHCGQIKFEAEVDPSKVVVCHCMIAKQLLGRHLELWFPPTKNTSSYFKATQRHT